MCGIVGGWWIKKPINFNSMIEEGIKLLHHRGPDDCGTDIIESKFGTLFLGQTRLSIIDLSEAGHQPMSSRDGNFTIIFNGEIYNYKELRSELSALGYEFYTESDTEVLLTAWAAWGDTCLCRFVGMFSFVVYDRKKDMISLVRDAFGIKPLFYVHQKDYICFASEIQTLIHLNERKPSINDQRVFEYLVYANQDIGGESFISDIKQVPPSHLVNFSLKNKLKPIIKKWWNPSIHEDSTISFNEAAIKLRKIFLDNVRLHLRSDVPIGIALSGGIDSSAIACVTRYLEPNIDIHTFSFIPEGSNLSEEKWIDIVNNSINAIPHKVIVKSNELNHDVEDLIATQGEPFCTTSMYAQYRVFRLANEVGVKVVLEGQGADELLAGYQGYHGQRMRSLFESQDFVGMVRFAKKWKLWDGRVHLSPWRAFFGQMIPDYLFSILQVMKGEHNIPQWLNKKYLKTNSVQFSPSRLNRTKAGKRRRVAEVLLESMINNGLPSLLRYGDRNAMRFSIENRVPFLTIQLAEFVLSLPENFLISEEGETKSIFREAMRGIVPDEILDRRDKVGFESPMGDWVSEIIEKIELTRFLEKELPMINYNKIEKFRSQLKGNQSIRAQDWRLINLLFWAKYIFTSQRSDRRFDKIQ